MKKILIIEDDKNIVLSLKMYLEKLKYEVVVASDGLQGIEQAQEKVPDLIMLDIILPKMDGYMVCEALKKETNTKNIPIVFISAKTGEKDIDKAFEVGGDDFIVKPFNHEKIKKVLENFLKEGK
ncbi:MAG: response regulator [Candidatus Humimicrobiaceae bacterium]